MSQGAQQASARVAAKNAVKIRAALAASVDGRRVYAQYMETNPPVTKDKILTRARARAWAMKNVKLDLATYKKVLAKHYADMYVLGQNDALESMAQAAKAQKAPAGAVTKPIKYKPNGMPIFDPGFSIDWLTWTPGNPAAAALISKPGGLKDLLGDIDIQARGIADFSHDLLGTALADGIARGDTPVTIANAIRDSLSSPERALTIAITEGQRAKIEANLDSYAANNVEQIEWTTNDPCPECEQNDGEIVNLGDEFPSGNTKPPVHPNCQCDVIPTMPDLSGTPDYPELSDEEVAARLDDFEMAVVADLAKYNPDQERDERGRFSSGGGDGSARFRDTRTPGTGRTLSYKEVEGFKNGSAAPHLISDGKGGTTFTAERQALHEQIINKALEGVPKSSDPTLHLLGGGPASGKSTMLGSGKVDVPTGKEAVQINADDVKEQIPEYSAMVAAGDPRAAMFSHEESSYIAKEIQARAYANGQNVVLDGTGNSSLQSLEGKIDTAHAYGYKVVGNYATVPSDVAVERANARAERTGRVVPESVVREIHASVSNVFPQAAGKFDQVNLWDNTGKSPVLLATGGGGQLDIKNAAGYQAFLDKAKG
jgi:SPP1 gp7 family putative phage head morphogenesis protein